MNKLHLYLMPGKDSNGDELHVRCPDGKALPAGKISRVDNTTYWRRRLAYDDAIETTEAEYKAQTNKRSKPAKKSNPAPGTLKTTPKTEG